MALFNRRRQFRPPARRWLPASLAAPADTLTLTKPVQYQTFQRSGTTGPIGVVGSHTGATEDIESSFNGGAYSTIASAVVAGALSGTLSGQTNGQGSFTTRKKTTTAASATVADVGIGEVFLVGGDSNHEGRTTNAQSYTHGTLKATKFREDDAWANGNDPIDTGTSGGSFFPLFATQLMADESVPVAFITAAKGSTDLAGSATTWASGNADYNAAIQQVTDSGVNAVRCVLMSLGPNAVVSASTPSQASIDTAMAGMANGFAAALPGSPKTMVTLFGEVTTGSPPDRRTAIDNYRKATIAQWNAAGNVLAGPNLIDQTYPGGVHITSDAQALLVAKRQWACVEAAFFGGSNARGPRLVSATWDFARSQMTVIFDRNLKTGLTFDAGAWIISDAGSPMTLSSIAYHGTNPAGLLLNTSAAAVGAAGTTTLTFASGNDAAGLVVPCTTDITPPTGTAFQIPAEPIYAATVAEVSAVTLTVANAAHAHTAESPTLTVASVLTTQDATHAHAADNLTLTIGGTMLVVSDAAHAHTAAGVILTVSSYLVISDALHGHTSEQLTLSGSGIASTWVPGFGTRRVAIGMDRDGQIYTLTLDADGLPTYAKRHSGGKLLKLSRLPGNNPGQMMTETGIVLVIL